MLLNQKKKLPTWAISGGNKNGTRHHPVLPILQKYKPSPLHCSRQKLTSLGARKGDSREVVLLKRRVEKYEQEFLLNSSQAQQVVFYSNVFTSVVDFRIFYYEGLQIKITLLCATYLFMKGFITEHVELNNTSPLMFSFPLIVVLHCLQG